MKFSLKAGLAYFGVWVGATLGVMAPEGAQASDVVPFAGTEHSVTGTVVFTGRHGRYCLVGHRTGDGHVITRLNIADRSAVPSVGDCVVARGCALVPGDFGLLDNVVAEPFSAASATLEPVTLSDERLKEIISRNVRLVADDNYRFVRFVGRVYSAEVMPKGLSFFRLETAGGNITAALPRTEAVDKGDYIDRPLVEVTGILDMRQSRVGRNLSVGEPRILLRTAQDLRIVPDVVAWRNRLMRIGGMVLHVVLGLVFVVALWGSHRKLRLRAQAVAVAKDRRRIAESLHDAVSQQLAGARMLIFSVKRREDLAEDAREKLTIAIEALESARLEVRNAVLKLQDDAFSLKTLPELIRLSIARAPFRATTRIRSWLGEFPPNLSIDEKSDLLAIGQEAVTNAVRHGHAQRVAILAGRTKDNRFVLSVVNDGTPFDPETALGPEAGHFGISGMRERAERNGFTLTFGRRKGWMEVRLERSFE